MCFIACTWVDDLHLSAEKNDRDGTLLIDTADFTFLHDFK